MPAHGIDCLVEYRAAINETRPKLPNGQTAPSPSAKFEHALAAYGLSHGSAAIKDEIAADIGNARWRGKWSPAAIIKYVTDDTHHLAELFEAMLCGRTQRFVDGAVRRHLKPMDTLRAQYRYRYSGPAVARMQWSGLPMDVANWSMIGRQRKGLAEAVIRKYDPTLKLDAEGNIISGLYWDDAAKGRWTWGKRGNNQFARFLIERGHPLVAATVGGLGNEGRERF